MKDKSGFTLIEMLVVVLIIGILAGIALPQYQTAVTKAKVASILPLMRRWYDALQEYKLQHGSYWPNGTAPSADVLGVNWPSDWECWNDERTDCHNDYWTECFANEEDGEVYCRTDKFEIYIFPPDYYNDKVAGKRVCRAIIDESHKLCKSLGGKLMEDYEDISYSF